MFGQDVVTWHFAGTFRGEIGTQQQVFFGAHGGWVGDLNESEWVGQVSLFRAAEESVKERIAMSHGTQVANGFLKKTQT